MGVLNILILTYKTQGRIVCEFTNIQISHTFITKNTLKIVSEIEEISIAHTLSYKFVYG